MDTTLVLLGFVVVVALIVWSRSAAEKALHHHVFDRAGSRQGRVEVRTKTAFVVPDMPAADVVAAVVSSLGYPTARPGFGGGMFLLSATPTEASFAMGNKFSETWVSTLSVADQPEGCHGEYGVARWRTSDDIPLAWKEMTIVARRISEVITGLGGTVKVTVPG